jgi:hypothetical protein
VTKKVTRKINADLVEILFESNPGDEHLDWSKLDDVHISNGRWESWNWLILEDPQGLLWAVPYGLGLTENQDNTYPWKGDGWCPTPPETVTAFQVVPRTKVVIEYEVWDADEAP